MCGCDWILFHGRPLSLTKQGPAVRLYINIPHFKPYLYFLWVFCRIYRDSGIGPGYLDSIDKMSLIECEESGSYRLAQIVFNQSLQNKLLNIQIIIIFFSLITRRRKSKQIGKKIQ